MKFSLSIVLLAALAAIPAEAQQAPMISAFTAEWPEPLIVDGIEILHVQKNVYMLVGGGANVTVQIGDGGVMLVDAGIAGQADKVLAAIRRLTRKPLRYLVSTSPDADKIGGNSGIIQGAGGPTGIVAGAVGRPANAGILTIAHENTANRMRDGVPGLAPQTGDSVPVSTFFTPRKDFYANGEPVEVLFQPHAHTDGDVIVFFRGSDVISAGDVFRTDGYPVIDTARGGTIDGVIGALNAILSITIPERNQMGGTRVIPGHGRISNESEVVDYRDMLTIIRDRVRDMVKKNMTVAQVKAAHPTLEYDGLYSTKSLSGDMFVETIYNEFAKDKQK
jgi:glyoxylase-like metal-dependent hydrolase (beta-lactamase superfamily II)